MSPKILEEGSLIDIKRYKIQYPVSAYTFPGEARIHQVRFDDKYTIQGVETLVELQPGVVYK